MTVVGAELVFARDRWERRHGFVVQGGRIADTGDPRELEETYPDHDREDWGNVAVVPGCVNGHAHSFQGLLRGLGDDLPFMAWRDRVLYPFAERLDRDAIRTGALFDFAEMVRAGVTTVVDFFYLHDRGNENDLAVIEAAGEIGLRIVLARSMYDWAGAPKRYQESPDLAIRNARALHDAVRGNARAFIQPAPHSIHGASPEMIQAGAALAEELDTPFHIHVAEGRYERELSIERHGMSPVRFLDSLGVLSKAVEADAEAVRAEDVLLAGTARGGEALGLPVGRIAADHAADLVVLDLKALSLQPAATAPKQVIYAMQPDAIQRVIVGGETMVEEGRLLRTDPAAIVAQVAEVTRGWALPATPEP